MVGGVLIHDEGVPIFIDSYIAVIAHHMHRVGPISGVDPDPVIHPLVTVEGRSEMDALIAYLQGLGTARSAR